MTVTTSKPTLLHATLTAVLTRAAKVVNSIESYFGKCRLNIKEELNPEREYIIAARTDILDQITTTDFVFLMDLFRPDIRAVSKITGIPLDDCLMITTLNRTSI